MPITALSERSIQYLGSTLVVSSPVTLVKELLDNAIDAKATNIEVIISPNTVDKVEVRDNGTGIHPDDYDALGRHGHTSKLRSFEELRTLGGSTLGFRGVALASANSLARVTITTRISSDPVAAILQLVPKTGGVLKQRPGSAPVGTTVSINGIYYEVPVREQQFVKESSKSLDQIKELLRSYAMARPQLRLAFKVLKSPKFNWSYSPGRDASVKEAVMQLFGAEAATQCFEKQGQFGSIDSEGDYDMQRDVALGKYTFEAFLMKPTGSSSQLPKHRYLSVDGRPLSAYRGFMKKLAPIYWKHLSNAVGSVLPRSQSDLFLHLNIICPVESYDANVDSSKNEVLFADEVTLIAYFEEFCKDVYGPLCDLQNEHHIPEILTSSDNNVPNPQQMLDTSHSVQQSQLEPSNPPLRMWTAVNSTDSRNNEGLPEVRAYDLQHGGSQAFEGNDHLTSDGEQVVELGGNRPLEQLSGQSIQDKSTFEPFNHREVGNRNVVPHLEHCVADTGALRDSSPAVESEPRILYHFGASPRDLALPPSLEYPRIGGEGSQTSRVVPGGPYRSPLSSPMNRTGESGLRGSGEQNNKRHRRREQPTPWTPPSSVGKRQEPWTDFHNTGVRAAPDGLKQTEISFGGHQRQRNTQKELDYGLEADVAPEANSQIGQTDHQRAFMSAKENFAQQLACSPTRDAVFETPNPRVQQPRHKQSKNKGPAFTHIHSAEVQSGEPVLEDKEPIKTTIPCGDPRAYLLRRQKSMTAEAKAGGQRKIRRLKSNLMPLENIPTSEQTHYLNYSVAMDANQVSVSIKHVERFDKYIVEGDVEEGLDIDLNEGRRIEYQLDNLLSHWAENLTGEKTDVHSSLTSLLKGKVSAVQI